MNPIYFAQNMPVGIVDFIYDHSKQYNRDYEADLILVSSAMQLDKLFFTPKLSLKSLLLK